MKNLPGEKRKLALDTTLNICSTKKSSGGSRSSVSCDKLAATEPCTGYFNLPREHDRTADTRVLSDWLLAATASWQ